MTKIAFEEHYVDDSGIECAVRFCGREETIGFERCGVAIEFPVEKLSWLRECLARIALEIESG